MDGTKSYCNVLKGALIYGKVLEGQDFLLIYIKIQNGTRNTGR